ncbi:MAG: DNA polymerase III subunit beta, partial [Clostridia bacterium]|nr:DNA polymerase III subunit beta [Clostridia bacterium]
MRFTCGKNQLANALSNVQKAVATRSTIPALEGVLIKTIGDNNIELCAYNTELGIKTSIDANIYKSGSIVINSHIFTDIIKKAPCDLIEIEIQDNLIIKIKAGQSNFELIGINPEDFPELPNISQTESINLSVEILRSMIKQTIFAVSDNDSKPVHTGTLFEIKPGQITLVSVDGFRLAMRTENIQEQDLEFRFVVPGKTLREVLRLLPVNNNINNSENNNT